MQKHIHRAALWSAAIFCAAAALNACGGGGSSGPNVLVSIAITPAVPAIAAGLTEQLKAIGTYSNGTTSDLTSSVIINWTSDTKSTATVSSTGLVTGVAQGTTVISAYSGSVIGTATLTVTPALVQSITVLPNPASAGVGLSVQLTAVGTYTDGTISNVTSGLTWTSSRSTVAIVNATGQMTGQSIGSATINVAAGSVTTSVPISILANAWGATGKLTTGRMDHTATLLNSGKVLAVGGYNGPGTEELYDPATETWVPTGALGQPVINHTATLLADGMVLVAGGFPGAYGTDATNAAYLYDPSAGTWSATGSMVAPRAFHTATLLPDGTVLVAGGQGSDFYDPDLCLSSSEIYNPVTGLWAATGSLNDCRLSHTATLLQNGKVLVAGGSGHSGVLSSAELYDPTTATWTMTGNLTTGVASQTATLLSNGAVLVAGGVATVQTANQVSNLVTPVAQLYDPNSGTWTATGSLLMGVFNHTATILPNGMVLVAGGNTNASGTANTPIAAAEIYDPSKGVWSGTGSLLIARYGHTATLLPNGTVMVVGGNSGLTSSETYFPGTNP